MDLFHYVSSDQVRFHQPIHLRPRRISHYRFLHVESGRGDFRLAGETFEVTPGWLGLLAPGVRENRYHAAERVSYLFVEFASPREVMDQPYLEFKLGDPHRAALLALLKTIHAQRSDPAGCLLSAAVSLLPKHGAQTDEPIDPRLAEVRRLIDRHPDRNPTVAELAAAAGISEPQLRRLFKSQLGTSPKQYLMQARMEFAQRLLRFEGMRVGQAAKLLGFASVYQFSAQYRKVIGHPPSAERR